MDFLTIFNVTFSVLVLPALFLSTRSNPQNKQQLLLASPSQPCDRVFNLIIGQVQRMSEVGTPSTQMLKAQYSLDYYYLKKWLWFLEISIYFFFIIMYVVISLPLTSYVCSLEVSIFVTEILL